MPSAPQSDDEPAPMSDEEREFHLEEFKQIRSELETAITFTESLLKYAVVIIAAAYSWMVNEILDSISPDELCLASSLEVLLILFPLWLPVVSVSVLAFFAKAYSSRIKQLGEYLLNLEDTLGSKKLGWEKFLENAERGDIAKFHKLAWKILLIVTVIVALIVTGIVGFVAFK